MVTGDSPANPGGGEQVGGIGQKKKGKCGPVSPILKPKKENAGVGKGRVPRRRERSQNRKKKKKKKKKTELMGTER